MPPFSKNKANLFLINMESSSTIMKPKNLHFFRHTSLRLTFVSYKHFADLRILRLLYFGLFGRALLEVVLIISLSSSFFVHNGLAGCSVWPGASNRLSWSYQSNSDLDLGLRIIHLKFRDKNTSPTKLFIMILETRQKNQKNLYFYILTFLWKNNN